MYNRFRSVALFCSEEEGAAAAAKAEGISVAGVATTASSVPGAPKNPDDPTWKTIPARIMPKGR